MRIVSYSTSMTFRSLAFAANKNNNDLGYDSGHIFAGVELGLGIWNSFSTGADWTIDFNPQNNNVWGVCGAVI